MIIQMWSIFQKFILIAFVLMSAFCKGQDSYNMDLMSNWDDDDLPVRSGGSYSDIWGYVDASGNEYAILGGIHDIFFFNITDPLNPDLVTRFEDGYPISLDLDPSIWRDFKTYSHYAYGVADEGDEGLLVFDLSSLPDTVLLVAQYDTYFTKAHGIYIDTANSRLYVAGSFGPTSSQNVIIYDLTDPEIPSEIYRGSLTGGYIHDIFVRENIAYASHGGNGLYIYDVSDVNNISLLGFISNYPGAGYNHSSWLTDDDLSLVFCDETHGKKVKIYDVSDPADMTEQDQFDSNLLGMGNSVAHNPFILGNEVFISYYHDGVQVFDFSDRENVVNVAYYDTYPDNTNYNGYDGAWGVYPFLPSGYIIASDISNGLFVLEKNIGILSVELLHFNLIQQQNEEVKIHLLFQNLQESSSLVIERSLNGFDYSEIFRKPVQQNETEIETVDKPGNGLYYYRVKVFDTNNQEIFNEIKSVSISQRSEIDVYPNILSISSPIIQVKKDPNTSAIIEIWDLNGRHFGRSEIRTTYFNLSGFITDPGIYQIRLIEQGNIFFAKPILITE